MKKTKLRNAFLLPIAAGLIAIFQVMPAQADLVLGFARGQGPSLSAITLDPGDSIVLDLLIGQTDATVRLDSVATSINAAEAELTIDGGSGLAIADFSFGDFFSDNAGLSQRTDQRLLFSVGSSKDPDPALGGEIPGVIDSEDGVNDDRLRIGTFTLTAGPTASGSFTINLFGGRFGNDSTTTTPDTPFDGVELAPNSLRVNVLSVPEPTSFAMLSLLGASMVCNRRRRTE